MEKSFSLHLATAQSALAAADPKKLFFDKVSRQGSELILGDDRFSIEGPGLVVALGKAAGPMLSAAYELFGDLSPRCEWLCVTKDLHPIAPGLPHLFASHPVPDERSEHAAGVILQKASALAQTPSAWLLLLLSGGASALACAPIEGVSLRDKQEITKTLLASGLDIASCNQVRKALSRFKGGGLLRALGAARSACIVLSDVILGDLSDVGSGPLAAPVSPAQVINNLKQKKRWMSLPLHLQKVLASPPAPLHPRADREGGPSSDWMRPGEVSIGDRRDLVRGAVEGYAKSGVDAWVRDDSFSSSVERLVGCFKESVGRLDDKRAVLYAGEPTLEVKGPGKGGRAQHTALLMAKEIAGVSGYSFLALASDGTDGPTDAAGAIVDEYTWSRLKQIGINPEAKISEFDSYHALDAVGALLRTGPTGTNVNDLYVLLNARD